MNKIIRWVVPLMIFEFFFPILSYAAARVTYLKIEGEVLVFSTNQTKATNNLACIVPETENQWSLSLRTQNGQSSYALLLTAIANDLLVDVVSAGDCKNTFGIERASSISLSK